MGNGTVPEKRPRAETDSTEAECIICYDIPKTYGAIGEPMSCSQSRQGAHADASLLSDSCAHTFCYECIRQWETRQETAEGAVTEASLRARSGCPVCRRVFKVLLPTPCVSLSFRSDRFSSRSGQPRVEPCCSTKAIVKRRSRLIGRCSRRLRVPSLSNLLNTGSTVPEARTA